MALLPGTNGARPDGPAEAVVDLRGYGSFPRALLRLARQLLQAILKRTNGSTLHRGTALVTDAALLAGLAWAWWPRPETYRPVQPYERGTLLDAVTTTLSGTGSVALVEGRQAGTVAL